MEELSKYIKIVDKSKERIETLMLFRCTTLEFAERFLKTGNIRFGMPQEWIACYEKCGEGRGDLLEGSFASIREFDERAMNFYKKYRMNVKVTKDKCNGYLHFQSEDVLKLRTFCIFGLDRTLFKQNLEGEDHEIYPTGSIAKKYFEDFCDIKEDDYDKIPSNKKPVLIMIRNPKEFFARMKKALFQLGFSESELVIHPVGYIDKSTPFLAGDNVPGELFLKDISFEHQSEIRVVLMPKKLELSKKIEDSNGIVDIGCMDDIAEIQDYYFMDFFMQLRGNSLLYVLPKPIVKTIDDPMEVINHIHQIYRDELPGPLLSIEKRDSLVDEASNFLEKKFNIIFDKKALTFVNKSGEIICRLNNIWEVLFKHGLSYYEREEYEKSVDQYSKAILLDPSRPEAWYNRAVSYFKIGDYEKMLNDMDKAIELNPTNKRYIKERNEQLEWLKRHK